MSSRARARSAAERWWRSQWLGMENVGMQFAVAPSTLADKLPQTGSSASDGNCIQHPSYRQVSARA
jgi:hypothetical protein